ncbi:hypothetical protein FRB97_008775 [Tulasnella sp. 331]|nr:hypothetical protein FRB97_008775 [Tulasnella sp. 331]
MSFESLLSATDSSTTSTPRDVPIARVVEGSHAPFTNVEEPQLGAKPTKALNRNTRFFLTSIYFQVEDKVYSVPDMLFPGAGYLKSAVGLGGGSCEEEPMQLDVTVSQMDNLMSVLLDRRVNSPLNLTISQWGDALGLATRWNLEAARNFIIDQISTHFPDHLADRIKLADAYSVCDWLQPTYETLCTRLDPPTEEEIEALGPKRLAALWKIREACRQPPTSQKNITRARCNYCSKEWAFELSGSAAPEELTCRSCDDALTTNGCSQDPQSPPTLLVDALELIKASTALKTVPAREVAATDGVGGSPPDGSWAEKIAEVISEAHVPSGLCHEYGCHPMVDVSSGGKGSKGKQVTATCLRRCLKCGAEEAQMDGLSICSARDENDDQCFDRGTVVPAL